MLGFAVGLLVGAATAGHPRSLLQVSRRVNASAAAAGPCPAVRRAPAATGALIALYIAHLMPLADGRRASWLMLGC
jgi:hypothetical protein